MCNVNLYCHCQKRSPLCSHRKHRKAKKLKPCIKWSEREGRQAGGFSLIELTIALGIVGFALVAILGLVPIGMKAFQDAMRLNVEAEIVQTISRELESTPWKSPTDVGYPSLVDGLPSGLGQYLDTFPLYFDAEGREIGSGATAPSNANFAVHVVMEPSTIQGQNVVASGVGANAYLLYSAKIFIAYRRVSDLRNRVSSGQVPVNEAPWIKLYPVLLSYKGI